MMAIESVKIIDEEVAVFDLQVETDETFIVQGTVVHNSDICIARSGLTWTLEGEPIGHSIPYEGGPPAHPNCRSVSLGVLRSWDELSGPNAVKTGKEGGTTSIDKAFERRLRAKGFSDAQIARAKRNAQASMDGQVAGDINFEAWLKTKPLATQEKILGPTKFRLWREGKLTSLRDLVDQSGNPLTVDELLAKVDVPSAPVDLAQVEAVRAIVPGGDIEKWYADVLEETIFDVRGVSPTSAVRKLAKSEAVAINQYTGSWFSSINRFRRTGVNDFEGDLDMESLVNAVNSGLDKLPNHEGTVYRGLSGFKVRDVRELYKPGEIIEELGFTSTSTNPASAFVGPRLVIRSKTGKLVEDLSGQNEQEVLFRSGTRFRVDSIEERRREGNIFVFLEEVE